MSNLTIEKSMGSTVSVGENTIIGSANKTMAQEVEGGHDLLDQVLEEFDWVIADINTADYSRIDSKLAPHLITASKNAQLGKRLLPTLQELRNSREPETKQAVDQVVSQIKDTINDPKSRWGWLEELKRPQKIAGAMIAEGYKDILINLGYENAQNIVLAFEEDMVLRYPEFQLNRLFSPWYQESEGFTADFVNYARALKLIQIVQITQPDLFKRENMQQVLDFAKKDPHALIEHVKTFNDVANALNYLCDQDEVDPMLVNVKKIKEVVRKHPFPLPLEDSENNGPLFTNLLYFARGLKTLNQHMETGELKFNVSGKTPEAVFAGAIYHLADLWITNLVEYKKAEIEPDTMVNALCEVLGYKFRNSQQFKLLNDPEFGMEWFDPQWGFSQKFIESLKR